MAIGLPPFITSAAEGIARRLARARSYIQERPELGAAIAGGLSAQAPPQEGFLGGFRAGLGGAYGGAMQQRAMQHEQERQAMRDSYEAERLRIEQERLGLERRRVAVAERPRQATPDEDYTVPAVNAEGETETAPYPFPEGVVGPGRKGFLETFGRERARSMFPRGTGRAGGKAPPVYKQQIQDIMRANPGMTEAEATNLFFTSKLYPVSGSVSDFRINPETGDIEQINRTTTRARPMPPDTTSANPLSKFIKKGK